MAIKLSLMSLFVEEWSYAGEGEMTAQIRPAKVGLGQPMLSAPKDARQPTFDPFK
jgi:hypothetical protein